MKTGKKTKKPAKGGVGGASKKSAAASGQRVYVDGFHVMHLGPLNRQLEVVAPRSYHLVRHVVHEVLRKNGGMIRRGLG